MEWLSCLLTSARHSEHISTAHDNQAGNAQCIVTPHPFGKF